MTRSLFFMPVYNQVSELPTVLREIAEAAVADVDYLIVNNGSTDGSAELIHESGHSYIDLEHNQGSGYAYMLSIDWALDRGDKYTFFGTIAGNAKMLAREIPRLLEPLKSGRAAYTSGSGFSMSS